MLSLFASKMPVLRCLFAWLIVSLFVCIDKPKTADFACSACLADRLAVCLLGKLILPVLFVSACLADRRTQSTEQSYGKPCEGGDKRRAMAELMPSTPVGIVGKSAEASAERWGAFGGWEGDPIGLIGRWDGDILADLWGLCVT